MPRKIKALKCKIDNRIEVGQDFEPVPQQWLAVQAKTYGLCWLLAHADDGVIWGKMEDDRLNLPDPDRFGHLVPPLRALSLQQARLFGPSAELRIWRNEAGWQACLIQDDVGDITRCYDEHQILWGNHPEKRYNGFTQISDGETGRRHVAPFSLEPAQFSHKRRALRLQTRHYLSEEENGLLRVTLSRLVEVEIAK